MEASLKHNRGALLLAVGLVVALEFMTNTLDTRLFPGDFLFYINMAQQGIRHNPDLVAPFAYRPVTPLLAGGIARIFSVSIESGFGSIAIAGAILQLFSVFLLAQHFRAGFWNSLLLMVLVALSFYHVKYLLFDVYRPEHLAYGIITLAMLALFRGQRWACWLLSCVGLLIREFCIIPAFLLLVQTLFSTFRPQFPVSEERKQAPPYAMGRGWGGNMSILLLTGAMLLLPRLLIPVKETVIYAELFTENPTLWEQITLPVLSFRRNLNLIFVLAAYLLPLLIIGSIRRLRAAWQALAGYRAALGLYSLLVLFLTLYGGTDLYRFVTYLYLPQVIFLAVILRDNRIPPLEIAVLVIVMVIFNRILWHIPVDDYNQFLDFYGGYHDRINIFIIQRMQELIVCLFVGIGVRGLLYLHQQQSANQ